MTIVLKNQTANGEPLEVTYDHEKGMNMLSYKKGDLEVIDQSTLNIFEERYAGLGAIIGPHFHRRHPQSLPKIPDESLFPHIARIKARGIQDPFSHGIGRYAPWNVQSTGNQIKAVLTGKDQWNGVPLSALEGQNFKMNYNAELLPTGLSIKMSVVSDATSLVGIHHYYHLPEGKGQIISDVQNYYLSNTSEKKAIPSSWNFNSQHVLTYDLKDEADFTFYPFPKPLEGKILLNTNLYRLQISYNCPSQENSWQLYYPAGASFVCIEPISSQDPRHPNLTVSSICIHIQILEGNDKSL